MKTKKLLKKILVFSLVILMYHCENREETINCFPYRNINVSLNLKLPKYASELAQNGWIYINEQESGTRGLILFRSGIYPNYKFKVYDRNAPHTCPDANTTLVVKDNTKIICPKDNAEWILASGQPIKVAGIPPKIYYYSYDPATEFISIDYHF